MLIWLLRVAYVTLVVGVAIFVFHFFSSDVSEEQGGSLLKAIGAAVTVLAVGGLVLFTDIRERNKQITTISALYFGLLLGLLLGWLVSLAVEPILQSLVSGVEKEKIVRFVILGRLLITVICCYISISTLLQTKDEFRFIIPYVEFSKQVKGGRPLVLDTSVIIDGRIADICDTRLIDTKLIVPRFVLNELQAVADSSDRLKRNRGRRGLDILKRLQTNPKIELQMHEGNIGSTPGEKIRVDERLVLFAKGLGARVVTNDFNLNKVAQLQGVDVINLNELANSLKTVALPGEYMNVKVVKGGDQPLQGVGYLEDGTMVVVEQGKNAVGTDVSIVVTSVLQTPAGRMIFGRIEAKPSSTTHAALTSSSGSYRPVSGSSTSHTPVKSDGTSQQHKPLDPGSKND
ncbi:TRAM domain-containing protein [soil metagenome]